MNMRFLLGAAVAIAFNVLPVVSTAQSFDMDAQSVHIKYQVMVSDSLPSAENLEAEARKGYVFIQVVQDGGKWYSYFRREQIESTALYHRQKFDG